MPSDLSPAGALVAAIAQAVGDVPRPVALHEPFFTGNEKSYVSSCIDDGWVSSAGPFVERFERDLAAACGARHAVVVSSGTCALHAALTVLGVKPGDEVLIPALTFVATANAVSHCGAVPHFVEVEEQTLGIDPELLATYLAGHVTRKNGQTINTKTGRRIAALMPVHAFGHPCRAGALEAVAREYGLIYLEDAAAALGSLSQGRPVGSGGVATFSFNGNKIITTGGGGAVVMQDEEIYVRIKHLTTTARQPHPWECRHDAVAWNYRLPNLNAALGCAQLEQLPRFVQAKRALALRYIETFAGVPGVRIITEPSGTQSNYWLTTLRIDGADAAWLDEALKALHSAGLLCRPAWMPLHRLPMYKDAPRARLTLTESLAASILNVPSGPKLGMPYVR